jgi:hypothetical protein
LALIMPSISCIGADGQKFEIAAGAVTAGFMELGTYRFQVLADCHFYVDDVLLDAVVHEGELAWSWTPGFFAGEVVAELVDLQGSLKASYQLDVSPDQTKLGSESFAKMLDTIISFEPALLFGTEDAQYQIGSEGLANNPHLQYSRLRRYGEQMLIAMQNVALRPLTVLRQERTSVQAHRVKRLDKQSIHQALKSPGAVALLRADPLAKRDSRGLSFDVSSVYNEKNNPANQALALVLHEVMRRCRQVSLALRHLSANEKVSSTRSPLEPRLARRINYLESLHRSLRRLERCEPFRSVTAQRLTAAGLNAISAHPAYARAYRFGWYSLRPGLFGERSGESLWISPTWEIYERWCYVMVLDQMRRIYPDLCWTNLRASSRADSIHRRGEGKGLTLDVWLQVRCPAVDRKANAGFSSLSGQRFPDIAITLKTADASRFIILDAKYRASRPSVLESMASAHLYHDCLRWHGRKPDYSLLLVPRGGSVEVLESSEFRDLHGVGVLALGNASDANKIGDILLQALTAK